MKEFVQSLILIPFVGYFFSLIIPERKEKWLSVLTYLTIGIQLVLSFLFAFVWLYNNHPIIDIAEFTVFKSEEYLFLVEFCFDKITLVYMLVGAFLTFLITIYSRYYLHKEKGYKRFFNTILFFYSGYTLIIFSGNFETMFMGWEILGISSFLLIAFYRERYLPVRNAVKVFSIYRLGDIGLILAIWLCHHLFHENISFTKVMQYQQVHEQLQQHTFIGFFISIMFLLSAYVKSAQLPFSSWLPRAMEGPTPSSAIFYGSLSVHMGAFLLLRTYPFWEFQYTMRVLVTVLGIVTAVLATLVARVQSSIKSQIAYASIAQIGLIFTEISFGWNYLALLHFAGNAFLRTYQLLISPSVVSYLIREQFFHFVPRKKTFEDTWPKRIENSIYIISIKELNLDNFIHRFFWSPLHTIGRKLQLLTLRRIIFFITLLLIVAWVSLILHIHLSNIVKELLPIILSVTALLAVVKSFSERKNVSLSWLLIICNHIFIAMAVSFNAEYNMIENIIYLSGVIVAGGVGYFIIRKVKKIENIDLNQFHGHVYEHPKLALVFLLSCLGLTGFPITPTFIGEDLIFSHIHSNQYILAFLVSLCYVIDGLALVRIYARVFLGPHTKSYHEVAYKSS